MIMKMLVMTLCFLFAHGAFANVSECVPLDKMPTPPYAPAKAFLNVGEATITVILNDGRSLSGRLVESDLGEGAVGFSKEDAARTGQNVTVVTRGSSRFVIVLPYMSMSMGNQLICK
jgi:hypothetical protein